MNFTEVERVIVDLGILGQLKRNSKISTYEPEYLVIQDHIPLITPAIRWLYGDKKMNTISRVKNLIDITEKILLDPALRTDLREQLLDRLEHAAEGLGNLEYTYSTNPKSSEQIKLIISKVNTILAQHQPIAASTPAPTAARRGASPPGKAQPRTASPELHRPSPPVAPKPAAVPLLPEPPRSIPARSHSHSASSQELSEAADDNDPLDDFYPPHSPYDDLE